MFGFKHHLAQDKVRSCFFFCVFQLISRGFPLVRVMFTRTEPRPSVRGFGRRHGIDPDGRHRAWKSPRRAESHGSHEVTGGTNVLQGS